ncbi:unnamed protein product [Amoebophrya sp. A120]|nr:unnamed protein product [Amoebophrya sp. A120]|eukprot:GSA120T00009341001.1
MCAQGPPDWPRRSRRAGRATNKGGPAASTSPQGGQTKARGNPQGKARGGAGPASGQYFERTTGGARRHGIGKRCRSPDGFRWGGHQRRGLKVHASMGSIGVGERRARPPRVAWPGVGDDKDGKKKPGRFCSLSPRAGPAGYAARRSQGSPPAKCSPSPPAKRQNTNPTAISGSEV